MPILVLLIGLALPLVELAVLVKVGQAVGLWKLLLLLLGMAGLGAALLYWQGWSALRQTQDAMLRGQPPVGPMLEGMLLVTAGVLLLVPGLITDVFALVLLVPPLRRAIARWLLRRAVAAGDVHVEGSFRTQEQRADPQSSAGPVIEGEFERIDERPIDRGPRSGREGQAG
jgi:UPF0716 protein FxsA